uniref:Putative secreted protein n=1 Tax=Anopheles darlingi TaxID=43151 RepID=A0A2M4DE55_ANODA
MQRGRLTLRVEVALLERRNAFLLVLLLGHVFAQIALQFNARLLRFGVLLLQLAHVFLHLVDFGVQIRHSALPLRQLGRLFLNDRLQLVGFGAVVDHL